MIIQLLIYTYQSQWQFIQEMKGKEMEKTEVRKMRKYANVRKARQYQEQWNIKAKIGKVMEKNEARENKKKRKIRKGKGKKERKR